MGMGAWAVVAAILDDQTDFKKALRTNFLVQTPENIVLMWLIMV
jgi:hypothetical protein